MIDTCSTVMFWLVVGAMSWGYLLYKANQKAPKLTAFGTRAAGRGILAFIRSLFR